MNLALTIATLLDDAPLVAELVAKWRMVGSLATTPAARNSDDPLLTLVPAADRVEAGEIRIGRALDEVEALASMPVDTMGFLINPDIPAVQRWVFRRRMMRSSCVVRWWMRLRTASV